MAENKVGNFFGYLFVGLFVAVFGGVGLFMGGLLAYNIFEFVQARQWQETQAKIKNIRLDSRTSRSSKGGRTTTHSVKGEFEYNVDGKKYRSENISFYKTNDNFGSFHRNLYDRLSKIKKRGDTVTCYYNPEAPSEAIICRDLRWEMLGVYSLFLLVFGGVGIGILFGVLYGSKKNREAKIKQREFPGEPWLHKPEWQDGTIRSSCRKKMYFFFIFAIFWNLVSSPMWLIVPYEVIKKGNNIALLGLLFPVIGIILIIICLRYVMQLKKFGESSFEMKTFPGVIGGKLKGVVRTDVNIAPEDGFKISLTCVNKYVTRTHSGSKRTSRTHERILFQDEHVIKRELLYRDFTQSAIPVLFNIPYDSRESSWIDPDNKIIWRLKVAAKVPGIDYKAEFEIPVFKTQESSEDDIVKLESLTEKSSGEKSKGLELDESMIEDLKLKKPSHELFTENSLIFEKLSKTSARFVFPMFRNIINSICFTFFFLIWTGVVVALFVFKAPLLFGIVFSLFEIFIIYAFFNFWFYKSVVEISSKSIILNSGLFAWKRREFDSGEIESILVKRGLQAGNRLYYNVKMRDTNGSDYTLAARMPNKMVAERVAEEMNSFLIQK